MKSTDVVKSGRLLRLIPLKVLIFVAVMISGCATLDPDRRNAPSPQKNTPFKLESLPSESVVVSEVRAVREVDGMMIYGKASTK